MESVTAGPRAVWPLRQLPVGAARSSRSERQFRDTSSLKSARAQIELVICIVAAPTNGRAHARTMDRHTIDVRRRSDDLAASCAEGGPTVLAATPSSTVSPAHGRGHIASSAACPGWMRRSSWSKRRRAATRCGAAASDSPFCASSPKSTNCGASDPAASAQQLAPSSPRSRPTTHCGSPCGTGPRSRAPSRFDLVTPTCEPRRARRCVRASRQSRSICCPSLRPWASWCATQARTSRWCSATPQ